MARDSVAGPRDDGKGVTMNRFRLLALLSSLPACAQAQQVPTLEQLIARYECNLPGKEVERLACPKDLSPEEAGEIRMQKIDDAHTMFFINDKLESGAYNPFDYIYISKGGRLHPVGKLPAPTLAYTEPLILSTTMKERAQGDIGEIDFYIIDLALPSISISQRFFTYLLPENSTEGVTVYVDETGKTDTEMGYLDRAEAYAKTQGWR